MMAIKSYKLFGSEAEFFLEADEMFSGPLMNEAYLLALRLQKIFNIYDDSGELSTLNRDRHITASPELLEVLTKSIRLCRLSNGEYDITLGKLFLQRKKKEKLEKTACMCSYNHIDIIGNQVKLLNKDVLIDLGSIAKGYIAERIARFFVEQGIESGFVNARGDVRVFGEERQVGIQHPRKDGLLYTISLKDKGIATSGDYKQYDKEYSNSHIINQKEIISASVVADNLTDADAYATILMVCSREVRERLINEIGFPAMIMDKGLNIKFFNGFEGLITHES
jgi:FAD:protein FMN transferase